MTDNSLEVRLLHADNVRQTMVAATFGDPKAKTMLGIMDGAIGKIRRGTPILCSGCDAPLHTLLSVAGNASFSAACAAPPGWEDQSRAIVLFMCRDCAPTLNDLGRQITVALRKRIPLVLAS